MKFAMLQLDNSIRGTDQRFSMIERLISSLEDVQFVVLPELSTPGYIPTGALWSFREKHGEQTKAWAVSMAKKYGIYIGCGYLDFSGGEYYNAYLIANSDGVCGTAYKEEPEANIFKRGRFPHFIKTPLGNIAVGICFDSHRECFYNGIKDEALSLILMPHAWAMSTDGNGTVKQENLDKIDFLGGTYANSFSVPVIFCNAVGAVDRMAGITGALMRSYQLLGQSAVYLPKGRTLHFDRQETCVFDFDLPTAERRNADIRFYRTYIDKGSALFRHVVIPLDIWMGIRDYEKHKPK